MDISAQVDTTLNKPGQDCRGLVFGLGGGRPPASRWSTGWPKSGTNNRLRAASIAGAKLAPAFLSAVAVDMGWHRKRPHTHMPLQGDSVLQTLQQQEHISQVDHAIRQSPG
jgi:hypothetical protein